MSLTRRQVEALLRPIARSRVLSDNRGQSHVSQHDVRAHLSRCFGFAGWSSEVLDLTLVREAPGVGKDGEDKGWAVTYRATVRLSVRDPQGLPMAAYDDVGTGTSPNLPTLGDAHDFACKVAVSMALKRAATNLGDGFGLSLYNKGQTAPLVVATLVMPEGEGDGVDVQADVPAQTSLGNDDAGSAGEEPADALADMAAQIRSTLTVESLRTAWDEFKERGVLDFDVLDTTTGEMTTARALLASRSLELTPPDVVGEGDAIGSVPEGGGGGRGEAAPSSPEYSSADYLACLDALENRPGAARALIERAFEDAKISLDERLALDALADAVNPPVKA